MDSLARCVTQRAIRKTTEPDRVNRVMRFLGLRTVIAVAGAAAVLAVPIVLVLGHVPAKSPSLARRLAAASCHDFDDHQPQLASRVLPATPTPAATAAATTPPSPTPPTPAAPPT